MNDETVCHGYTINISVFNLSNSFYFYNHGYRLENRISEGQEGSTHNLLHCVQQLLRPKLTIREVANTRFRLFKHSVFYSKTKNT